MSTRRSLQRFTIAVAATLGVTASIGAHATLTAVGSGNSPSSTNFNSCSVVFFTCVDSTQSTTSQLFIGFSGTGNSLTIDGSSSGNGITTLNANSGSGAGLNIGAFGGVGTVTVDGGTLNSVRSIVVGSSLSGTAGTGTLNVQNGGLVQTTGTDFGITVGITAAIGTVNVSGAGSLLRSAGRIQVGAFDNSTGTLTISGGGAAQTTGTTLAQTELEIGTGANATGTVTVTGAGSTLTAGGIFLGTGFTANNTSSLLIQNGATVTTNEVSPGVGGGISIGGTTSATVTVTGAGSTLNVGPLTGFLAGKEILIGGFGNGALIIENSGTVNAVGGNVIVSGGAFGTQTTSPGVLTVRTGGTLTSDTVTINTNGTVNGDGTITADVVLNGGTLSPGNSPGVLTIDGDLTLNDGTLVIELDSPSVFDQLDVSGNIFVGGDLEIDLLFGFQPSGDIFIIEDIFLSGFSSLTFNPAFNLFDNISVSGLAAGSSIILALDGSRRLVTQASVPLPSTIALILIGLAGLGFARRRKLQ